MTTRTIMTLERVGQRELRLCQWFNRGCRYGFLKRSFSHISWLGDGKLWYTLMAVLPLVHGRTGLETSLRMAAAGIAGLVIYKSVKSLTRRLRPCAVDPAINQETSPLDRYSFPSGHTLHAVSFSVIATASFPALAWLVIPFTLLIALSRVVLGLHYPTDVGIGAAIGLLLAVFFLNI